MKPHSLRVLIADDDCDTAHSLAFLLRDMGHAVETAMSGQATLDQAERMRPDLILLDLKMPDIDGWTLARTLKNRLPSESVRLVAITGFTGEEARIQSRKAGFDAHVAKPIDMALLESILAQVAG